MVITETIKKIRKRYYLKNIKEYTELSPNSLYENSFRVYLHCPNDRKYLVIGQNCMIGAKFVFESSSGFVKIGNGCQISSGTTLISRKGIIIGDNVIIAGGSLLYDHDSHSIFWDERKNDVLQQIIDYRLSGDPLKNKNWEVVKSEIITIKNKVWIGTGVTILKGVTIGEGAVIGAKAVVTHDVEPYTVVAGNPARKVKEIEIL